MRGTAQPIAGGLGGIAMVCGSLLGAAEAPPAVPAPVIVTAPRADESAVRYLVGAKVITAQDIEASRTSTLSDLLRYSSEVRIRDLTGSPNPQIDLRGFGGLFGDQNTLVLVDGVRVREYEQLTVNWSAMPLSSIERIEILPAGSAILYGGGATGGAINIITKTPASGSKQAEVGGEIASYRTRELHAGASGGGQNASLRVHGSHFETDNYRDNSRVRIDNAQADLRWTGEASLLNLKFGADDQRTGLPGVISEAQIAANRRQAARNFDFATQDGDYVHLAAHGRVGSANLGIRASVRQRDTESFFLVGTPLSNRVATTVRVATLAPQIQLTPEFVGRDDAVIAGAEVEDWKFDGNSGPTIPGRPHSTQRSAALYALYNTAFASGTTLALGARGQHVRYGVTDLANPAAAGERSHNLHAWEIAVRHPLQSEVHVHAKVGSSFRLPNVNDNFNPTFARVTLLEPQTARDVEVGVEWNRKALRLRAAAFRAHLRNEIFFDPVTLGSRNRQPTRRQGLTFDGSWQVAPSLELYANYIYADATFREGTAGGRPIAGNRVPLAPRHTLNAGARWALSGNARVDFDVHSVGSSVFDADETNTFGREIPAYTVADLKLSMRSGGWLINAGVRNLFNEKYLSYGVVTGRPTYSAVPAEERRLFVSAQYAFE